MLDSLRLVQGAETVATGKEAFGEIMGSLAIIFLSWGLAVIRFFYNVSLVSELPQPSEIQFKSRFWAYRDGLQRHVHCSVEFDY